MDINEDFDQQQVDNNHHQQQYLQQQQQLLQQQQQQQQQMQCDPPRPARFIENIEPYNNGPSPFQLPSQIAIPLPPPPSTQTLGKAQTTVATSQAPPSISTEIDIDALLLQQFSCLGTTDHEDLINQFQSLMNNQMNKDSAKFFLEMSNWNLQTAVGCYLDFCNFQTIPSMKIVQQDRPSEFQQAWRLQNDGTEDWPRGCYLMSPSQTQRIEIPPIKRGETCDILADVPASQPAVMWRLCTPNGWYFGETIWMIPPGTCNTQAELAERMAQLRTSSNPESFPQINVVISVNME